MSSWEYLYVNACLIPGPGGGEWHPHLVNNEPLPDWDLGPPLDTFIRQLEAQGWQLARKSPNTHSEWATTFTLLFKRAKRDGPSDAPIDQMKEPPASAW